MNSFVLLFTMLFLELRNSNCATWIWESVDQRITTKVKTLDVHIVYYNPLFPKKINRS